MGATGSPVSLGVALLGHLLAGLGGYWAGHHLDIERHLEPLASAAADIAAERCQEWVENRIKSEWDWLGDPNKPQVAFGKGRDNTPVIYAGTSWILTAGLATGWLLLVVLVVAIWCHRRGHPVSISNPSSSTSLSSQRALAHQQLAEVRLRKHVADK